MERHVDERFGRVVNVVVDQGEFLVEFLEERDVAFLRGALRTMVDLAANPLSKGEKRRLIELIDKGELTLEEAEELLRLARRFVMEYGDRGPEVWKLLWYAAAMHGIALRKAYEGRSRPSGEASQPRPTPSQHSRTA